MRRSPRFGCPPSTVTLPLAMGTSPRSTSSSVVLPEPFGPMTPTTAPTGTSKVPSDQIVRPPRATVTPRSDTAGGVGADTAEASTGSGSAAPSADGAATAAGVVSIGQSPSGDPTFENEPHYNF